MLYILIFTAPHRFKDAAGNALTGVHLALDENKSRRQIGVVKFDQRKCAKVAISWLDGYVYGKLDLRAELATPNDLVCFYATKYCMFCIFCPSIWIENFCMNGMLFFLLLTTSAYIFCII